MSKSKKQAIKYSRSALDLMCDPVFLEKRIKEQRDYIAQVRRRKIKSDRRKKELIDSAKHQLDYFTELHKLVTEKP